jgi:hypothetical protein
MPHHLIILINFGGIRWWVQHTKFPILHLTLSACHFLSMRSHLFPQHSVFKTLVYVKDEKIVIFFLYMKAYGGNRYLVPLILNLCSRWRWVIGFTLRSFVPREGAHAACWIGCSVSPRAGLDLLQNAKILVLIQESNLGSSGPWPGDYTNWAILAPFHICVPPLMWDTKIHIHVREQVYVLISR